MIKIENVKLASLEQMEFIIQGMRNPLDSWDKSDSSNCWTQDTGCEYEEKQYCCLDGCQTGGFVVGPNDWNLMKRLANAGTDHRKFMRMMPVFIRITAPLYWFKEVDTYKVGTVANSCSTMHRIHSKEFTLDDFSHEHLFEECISKSLTPVINNLNYWRNIYLYGLSEKGFEPKDKNVWWQMIQILPSSYNQTRNYMLNYEVLSNIYHSRKNHKLDEWNTFCNWIETLPYSELITGGDRRNGCYCKGKN